VTRLLTVRVARDEDLVTARRRARQIAEALGFDRQDQTRIATVVSEMARNAVRYARGGRVEFTLDTDDARLHIAVIDSGGGIPHLQSVLDGIYRSETGMGLGILGARRMMDDFAIDSTPAGTTVRMAKAIPTRSPVSRSDVRTLADRLASAESLPAIDEVAHQNRELLVALEELRQRQEDLGRLNAELQDTNRGVVALYAELDEKAESLRRADEMKSKFLSNMTHEFQTPLNSILALTRLLLDRTDGDLAPEQEKQVQFIRQATEDLSELVHDLLDIAKVEAGKVTVRPTAFTVASLFGALRGLMRPLQRNDAVVLVFDAADDLPTLMADEGKISQILRNYISNALKFTERGEVRVSAVVESSSIRFTVSDTGIGIAPDDQARLFHEFGQVPNRLQAKVRGTGLGLSLSKRLAELLGGAVGVESVPGEGSTFWLEVPLTIAEGDAPANGDADRDAPAAVTPQAARPLALVIDDEAASRYVLRRCLEGFGCEVVEAHAGQSGLRRAASDAPAVIFLDLNMPDMGGAEVLARLKRDQATAHIPVIIATSQIMAEAERQRLLSHAVAVLGKARLGEPDGVDAVKRALQAAHVAL